MGTNSSRRYHPKDVLHEYCASRDMQCKDIPEDNLTRAGLQTKTYFVQVGFRFDSDGNGYKTTTPLGEIIPNDDESRGKVANFLCSNPKREIVPFINAEGVVSIEISKSSIPNTKAGIKRGLQDIFGRISSYVDDESQLPLLKQLLE